MPPQACRQVEDQQRLQDECSSLLVLKSESGGVKLQEEGEAFYDEDINNMECVLQPRLLTDFSYTEKPLRFTLSCQDKHLKSNGKTALYMADSCSSMGEEFILVPQQQNGTVLLQSSKTNRFLCSNPNNGRVYLSETCFDDLEKWILKGCQSEETGGGKGTYYMLMSTGSKGGHCLSCIGNTVCTIPIQQEARQDANDESVLWKVNFTSGELCFLSMSCSPSSSLTAAPDNNGKLQVRCDMLGNLSLSKNYQGWEVWRLSEVPWSGRQGLVRITAWAHSNYYLSSNELGDVFTSNEANSQDTLWSVQKAPNGLCGVLLKSAHNDGRVLRYDDTEQSFETIPGDAAYLLDESCAWEFESVHRQTYYIVGNSCSPKRLEAAKRGLTTRGLPGRLISEEWQIHQVTNEPGVLKVFSNARQQYLGSNSSGDVFLATEEHSDENLWVIEERGDEGFVILSADSQRVLVAPNKEPPCTVEPGTSVVGNTRWKLEPKLPRQINKEKMQAVGAAVAIGVVGTVATPFVIGGAIGIMGIAEIGVAGQVAIGSIRAAEAINTITRVTLSSSQLMMSQSSFLDGSSSDSSRQYNSSTDKDEDMPAANRPFSAWKSW